MEELKTALNQAGLTSREADKIAIKVASFLKTLPPEQSWQKIAAEILNPKLPFAVHLVLYKTVFPDWEKTPAPAWLPQDSTVKTTNLAKVMAEKGFKNLRQDYPAFHRWSVENYPAFWAKMTAVLNINFDVPYNQIVDLSSGVETPHWFAGAKLNIVNSCFQAKKRALALISQTEQGKIQKLTYEELDKLSNRIANSLSRHVKPGARLGIIMPMTAEAVALFLGIVKAGCVVIAIPDSFSPKEIETRLQITPADLIFCQHQIIRAGKILPLYERLISIKGPKLVVLPAENTLPAQLRPTDLSWHDFLSTAEEDELFTYVACEPHDPLTVLFSSGTSGPPKAIPWNHTTPIKCASDAYLHHNLQAGNVFCWPSNLGWMMGPWLIFACLLNKATIALYSGAPVGKNFGQFIHKVQVTHLGVVPTMVKNWRTTGCMEGFSWKAIKLFTSTGERSNIDDMLYLMSLADYSPVIEYCGGTEIGGAYITGTLLQPAAPSAFTTPALGLDFVLLNESGEPAEKGEVALIPPSIGLSTELINQNHHQVYYANLPKSLNGKVLRRHGDQIEHYANGFYRLLGRVDDVMKLGGIKVSSAELESCIHAHPLIYDAAAVAIDAQDGGPAQLIIFAVLKQKAGIGLEQLKTELQNEIKQHLNPLFKIEEIIALPALPRTASNKILRRVLRDNYLKIKQSLNK